MPNLIPTIRIYTLMLVTFLGFRFGLYFYQNEFFSNLTLTDLLEVFLNGLRFDTSIILTFCIIPFALLNLPFKFVTNKLWKNSIFLIISIIYIAFIFLLAVDLSYFPHVKRHIGNELLMVFDDIEYIKDIMLTTYLKPLIAILTLMPFGVYFIFKFSKIRNIQTEQTKYKSLARTLLFILFIIICFGAIRGVIKGKSLHVVDAYNSGSTEKGILTLNGVFTAYHQNRKIDKIDLDYNIVTKQTENKILADNLKPIDINYPFLKQYSDNNLSNYNIIFVLLESWSFNYIDSFAGTNYQVTPNFDKLAKEGIMFTNFYAAGQRSIDAIQATLTGIPVLVGQKYIGTGLESATFSKIGNLANEIGYQTIFIQSSKSRSYRMDSIAKSLGFKEMYGKEHIPILLNYPDEGSSNFGWDYETYMHLLNKIKPNEKFLGYLFTGTTHTPYPEVPIEFTKYPHDRNNIYGFLNTLNYADWALGQFIKDAKSKPWFNNTIFIFCADHVINESEYVPKGHKHPWFKNTTIVLTEDEIEKSYFVSNKFIKRKKNEISKDTMYIYPRGHALYTSGLKDKRKDYRIPLLIYAPNIFKPEKITKVYSQLDLMPTMIDLMGINTKFASFGDSVFRKKDDFVLATDYSTFTAITKDGYIQRTLNTELDHSKFYLNNVKKRKELNTKLQAYIQSAKNNISKNKWFYQYQ